MPLLDRISGEIIRLSARALAAGRVEMTVTGLEQIPADGPVLLVARHYHHLFDGVVLLLSVPRPLHILVTLDWAKNTHVRRLLKLATSLARWPVVLRDNVLRERGDCNHGQTGGSTGIEFKRYQRAVLRDCAALLGQGNVLVVFPEGYPNIDPHYTPKTNPQELLPFRTGFATIAAVAEKRSGTNVPIVPTGFHYTKDSRWMVQVAVGEPVHLQDFVSRRSLVSYVERRITELSRLNTSGA